MKPKAKLAHKRPTLAQQIRADATRIAMLESFANKQRKLRETTARQIRELQDLRAEDGPKIRMCDFELRALTTQVATLERKVDSHAQWHGSHDATIENRLCAIESRLSAVEAPAPPSPVAPDLGEDLGTWDDDCFYIRGQSGATNHSAWANDVSWRLFCSPTSDVVLTKGHEAGRLENRKAAVRALRAELAKALPVGVVGQTDSTNVRLPAQQAAERPKQVPVVGLVFEWRDFDGDWHKETISTVDTKGVAIDSDGALWAPVPWSGWLSAGNVRINLLPRPAKGMRVHVTFAGGSTTGTVDECITGYAIPVVLVRRDDCPDCNVRVEWLPMNIVVLSAPPSEAQRWAARRSDGVYWDGSRLGDAACVTRAPGKAKGFSTQQGCESWANEENKEGRARLGWTAVPYPQPEAKDDLAERATLVAYALDTGIADAPKKAAAIIRELLDRLKGTDR